MSAAAADAVERTVVLTPDDVTPPPPASGVRAAYWTARRDIERRYPMAYDRLRQTLLGRRERRLARSVIPRDDGSDAIAIDPVGAPGGLPAVLVGMHWLELGGAESWAIETVRIVAETGLTPVVVTDRYSEHPYIADDLFRDVVVLPFAGESPDRSVGIEQLRQLLERCDLRGVLVHHCNWLYNRLPWIREMRPEVPVVDSLHILEYAGGGYPAIAVRYDESIDLHHVISPSLERWLTVNQRVPREKVVMAPLTTLTLAEEHRASIRPRAGGRFTISFVGRLVRQKRPYLFVRLLSRLRSAGIDVRAILHGDGELLETTRRRLREVGLDDAVELRESGSSVARTLAETDLLVIPSQNEGLTLTTMEAIAEGVPVLSTDVGSQATLVAAAALMPREPRRFLEAATRAIGELAASEAQRERVWLEERRMLDSLIEHPDAGTWMREVVRAWRV